MCRAPRAAPRDGLRQHLRDGVPPAPSPANINVCSARSRPVSGAAASTPASTTAAVPCSNSQHHPVASEFLEVDSAFVYWGSTPASTTAAVPCKSPIWICWSILPHAIDGLESQGPDHRSGYLFTQIVQSGYAKTFAAACSINGIVRKL